MKIRARLTLWYATILSLLLIVIGIGTYQEIFEQSPRGGHRRPWAHALEETGEMVVWVGLPALFFGLLGGWWITGKALAPVAALTRGAEKIHERNLADPLPRSGNGDELDRLTEVFNAMTARLNDSFQRIREFTLHASHELKTPLTIMRGELELALADENLPPAQRERMLSQMDETERLAKIVDGLTLLTRADTGQIQLNREPVPLADLARETFADAKILAQSQAIEVSLDPCEEVVVTGDRHRLRQLLLNLTDNAIKYNQPGGKVNFSLRRVGKFAELKIQNTGPGLAPELQPRVFERFFRGDTSHASALEGCGLGLSIAQWIVKAHDGEIHFASEPDKTTLVTIRLQALS